ncbi:hypothetical protein [Actinomadura nitritigenes]|uniref:hypothetical protein n=1 Tax=Actinomadura nitritigenes TaxID=134602 RepID=UPI003D90E568
MYSDSYPGLTDWDDELVAVSHPAGTRALAVGRRYRWVTEQLDRARRDSDDARATGKDPMIRHTDRVVGNWRNRLDRLDDRLVPYLDEVRAADPELAARVRTYIIGDDAKGADA